MEMVGMALVRPKVFQVFVDGKSEDISASLQTAKVMKHEAWKANYTIKRPGVYQFAMEPQPYWEPAEDCFIIHYTKAYVAAFGEEEGWDEPLGLKTEIIPLTRPFGNYAGNVFQGQVLLDGKPVPNAEVEVEYYNKDGSYSAPNEYLVTQVVKADANGIFTYGIPFAGWWGFAALSTADEKMKHEAQEKDVELGAVLWMEFVSPIKK
jgi:cobalt/nickel transport protein